MTLRNNNMKKQSNSQEIVESFLKFVEVRMDQLGISVPKLAEMIDTPRETIYTWLNGKSVMSLEKAFRVIHALDLFIELRALEDVQGVDVDISS